MKGAVITWLINYKVHLPCHILLSQPKFHIKAAVKSDTLKMLPVVKIMMVWPYLITYYCANTEADSISRAAGLNISREILIRNFNRFCERHNGNGNKKMSMDGCTSVS